MKISILTVCPECLNGFENWPNTAHAISNGALELNIVDIRKYAGGSFRHVDDSPFGGGAGCVLRAKPILDAVNDLRGAKESEAISKSADPYVVLLSPSGRVYNQEIAHDLAGKKHLALVCGHYEGVDARIMPDMDDVISIGDYVLSGGEPAAEVLADSVIRLLDGVIKKESTREESFEDGLLECPQYTQPASIDMCAGNVPEVLLSGDHERIRKWRRQQSLLLTLKNRPDLIERARADGRLSDEDEDFLLRAREQLMR
ncbi:MAG: tRNA (guanosine(37)-N1)-methyltransferase TrmD [Lachnospiraceae bacterium]|nr:tRNA (guanosine(37)-N1)-methyltransferase TrmD [Lachnospiraceae bacterium]